MKSKMNRRILQWVWVAGILSFLAFMARDVMAACNAPEGTKFDITSVNVTATNTVVAISNNVTFDCVVTTSPTGYEGDVKISWSGGGVSGFGSPLTAPMNIAGDQTITATVAGDPSATCETNSSVKVIVLKVELTTTKGHGLWWFGGENAVNYDESGTMTAQGATTGAFKWDVMTGAGKVDLNNGGADSDNITATDGNTVTIKSTDASVDADDVAIQLTYNGTVVCQYSVTVKTPKAENEFAVLDSAASHFGHTNGYASLHYSEIVDQYGDTLPAEIEWNEKWIEASQNDYTPSNSWDMVTQGSQMIDPVGYIDYLGQVRYGGSIPNTRNPQTPLGNSKVYHWRGEHYVGSLTGGKGVKVLTKKWQYYEDHGRRE